MNSSEIPGFVKEYEQDGFTSYSCPKDEFPKAIFYLGSEFSYIWLLGIQHYSRPDNTHQLKYYFLDFEERERFSISYELRSDEKFYSVVQLWQNASFYEERIINKTGLTAQRDYKLRLQV